MKKMILWALALIPASLWAQGSNFSLDAKIGEIGAPAKAYLFYIKDGKTVSENAAVINGSFKFTGSITEPTGASIILDHTGEGPEKFGARSDRLTIILEKGNIGLSATDSLKNAVISGSKLNEENKVFMALYLETKKEKDKIRAAYRSASPAMKSDQKFKDDLQARFDLAGKAQLIKQEELIKQYPDSYASLIVVVNEGNNRDKIITVEPLYKSLSERLRNSPSGLDLGKKIEASKNLSMGATAPSFTQNDVNDKPVSLADFRGKYVLIDFWASWCGPCRAENPNVVKAYQAYKDKNFTVLGVSLDQPGKKANWLAAIKADGLVWTQVSDLQYWDNAAAKLYGIKGIPQNYLLDPSGKIVGINLRGEALNKKLAELIK